MLWPTWERERIIAELDELVGKRLDAARLGELPLRLPKMLARHRVKKRWERLGISWRPAPRPTWTADASSQPHLKERRRVLHHLATVVHVQAGRGGREDEAGADFLQ
ncbi:hypothetical protein G6O67_005232 [Ophiocordyceps sinensis]|uniref:Uncharacterized protein n=2 Tax=Ophiocordyceps sinensis TaxID=72228 RepID=A0A8H4PR17_9HYPO|nr:hypothetical protein OCS_01382 [Ophiocordyceps sinensis CO18]KAF4508904.1 hypothetical protein G6O67_005232 [Ophiocordyceps sinensis]